MGTLDRRLSAVCTGAALALAVGLGASTAAKAQSQADFAQLLEAMKRVEARANTMEARLAALEKENRQVKQEAAEARAESRSLRQKYGTPARPTPPAALPHDTYAMATKAPPLLERGPSWDGLYWGAAFGVGSMRARDNRTGNASSTVTLGPPVGPPTQTQITTETFTADAPFGERSAGGIVNLYLGYNFLSTPSVVLGAQVEGGVANIRVKTGPATRMFNENTGTFFDTGSIGEYGNRWMASVLGRAGVLVDPQDLLYLIGGYTYARSDESTAPSFNLDGATIGAGWERQIASGWSLRGEYRYTTFRSRDVTETTADSFVDVFRNSAGMVTSGQTQNDTRNTTTHVSADMHSLWLGVAHYFGH